MVLESISERIKKLPLRGVKGTVGTQATYMQMFNDDEDKVDQLDEMVCRKMGFEKISTITGQTYSRLFDVYVLDELKNLAGCLHKICLDIRLLAHDKEVEEPFEAKQIGSSAMAYKRNPMRSERVNGLARHIFALASEPIWTYANQMFERTLDDSAPRRIYIPQTFLTADAILTITINVVSGLQVWPEMISKRLQFELPFMATEQIIVACVKAGADRDAMHHLIRDHSMEVGFEIKSRGAPNNLFKRIRSDDRFPAEVRANLDAIVDPKKFIGRSAGLVDKFIRQDLDPLLEKVEGKSAASKRQFDLELRV